MNIAKSVAFSCKILAAHRLRTLLCVSSLAIGVAAVVVMVSMGRSAERRVLELIADMGTNLIVVNAGRVTLVGGRERQSSIVTTLVAKDADAIIEQVPSVIDVAPETNRRMTVEWGGQNVMTTVVGTTTPAFRIRNLAIEAGRAFDDRENDGVQRVAVLGSLVADRLFGERYAVGHQIRIGRALFDVVGVTSRKGIDANGVDRDDRVLIPIETAMRRMVRTTYIQKIHVRVADGAQLERTERGIRELLRERHRLRDRPDDFMIQNQTTLIETERSSARLLTVLAGSVATISLLVGGVGILAVMLTAGRERRQEIGLRRAVGARRRDIRTQFLLESLILSALGGIAGGVMGMFGMVFFSRLVGWEAVGSLMAVVVGFLLSALIGLAFGIYPADRASRLQPADAVRVE